MVLEHEPPTEPFIPSAAPPAPPPPPPPPVAVGGGPFAQTRYRFTTGLRAGEIAPIRGDEGQVLLSYRSFASAIGVVATLVSGIVMLAGLAAVLFLIAEEAPARAAVALVLTLVFAVCIAMLVPRINVTLYDENHPALTLSQRAVFPIATYIVSAPNGTTLAEVRRTFFSRIGRNRWTISQEGRLLGEAVEESWGRAVVRKVLGKFSRTFETNLRLEHGGLPAGHILRRPDAQGTVDVLELTNDALDRRVAVAVAMLVLGREP